MQEYQLQYGLSILKLLLAALSCCDTKLVDPNKTNVHFSPINP